MFDFEKLEVYKKAKDFNIAVYQIIQSNKDWDKTTRDQLRRASFSIQLNIAEGSSRFSKADRKNFFVIARGSVFECVSIIDFLISVNLISPQLHQKLYTDAEELSKILFTMVRNLEN